MPSIDLYQNDPSDYETIQMLRPDYAGAKAALLELAIKYLDQKEISIADFCCGTGINTKMLATRLPISRAILIDHNQEFIDIARKSNIQSEIEYNVGDILQAALTRCADAVISMFAYHHIRDDRKADYLRKATDVLKENGLLFLGEIYMPDKQTTLKYYRRLYESIPQKSEELEKFLLQTAESDDYEYKVTKQFADQQLKEAGFELIESRKIWPTNDEFGMGVGTYVEVWRVK